MDPWCSNTEDLGMLYCRNEGECRHPGPGKTVDLANIGEMGEF